jgi:hypothetical protein
LIWTWGCPRRRRHAGSRRMGRMSFGAHRRCRTNLPTVVYLLLAAVAISLLAWVLAGGHSWPVDAIVIAVVVVLNAVLGYVQEARAESAVAALQEMTAVTSSVLRDGRLVRIPSDQLVRGDLLVLGEGDAVGADGRLTEAAALRVLEASSPPRARRWRRMSQRCRDRLRSATGGAWSSRAPPTLEAPDGPSLPLPGWRRKRVPSPTCWRRPRRSAHHCRPRWVGCWR